MSAATADALMAIFGFKRVEGNQMKTDRELLELAAKAAGVSFFVDNLGRCMEMHANLMPCPWSPLQDDGDALRLAVKLRIDLEWREDGRISAYRHAHADGHCFTAIEFTAIESGREDSAAATRRAIVRAAAAIGEGME